MISPIRQYFLKVNTGAVSPDTFDKPTPLIERKKTE